MRRRLRFGTRTADGRRMGYNAALAGVAPSFEEPMECFQGYVLGLNQKIADSYSERSTEYEGSEPVRPGEPVNNDSLIPGQTISDPTPSQRRDFADDADDRNEQGESDKETANHVEDFEPKTEKTTKRGRSADQNPPPRDNSKFCPTCDAPYGSPYHQQDCPDGPGGGFSMSDYGLNDDDDPSLIFGSRAR